MAGESIARRGHTSLALFDGQAKRARRDNGERDHELSPHVREGDECFLRSGALGKGSRLVSVGRKWEGNTHGLEESEVC
jgi:hypothetical protein